jgi:autotransporter-associated beta strand protein
MLHVNSACGQSGTWTNLLGGSWAAAANWSGGTVAAGSDNTADFSTLTLSAAPTVTLDGARTLGNLIFGDLGKTYGWTLNTGSGGPLTLVVSSGSPTLTVNGQTTTIGLVLAGTQGLTKAGSGTLVLSGNNTYTNPTVVNQGSIQVSGSTGTLGVGGKNSVVLNGGAIVAAFAANVTPTWPINVDTNGGEIDLTSAGRWLFTANTITGSGTLTLKPGSARFQLYSQSGFSGKWVLDGSNRTPAFNNGFWSLSYAQSDISFGASPPDFTPDAITLINNGGIQSLNAVGPQIGSPTRGITIGSGGGSFIANGANTFAIDSQISGTTGDPVYYEANNNLSGVQLNNPGDSYNGNTVIYNYGTATLNVYLRLGADEVIPDGPGKGLLAFSSGTAILDLNGYSETINGFVSSTSSSVVDDMAAGGNSTLTVGNADTTSSFAGVIKNTTGIVNLVKTGSGTLTLAGANTYNGSTTINGGVLAISPAQQGGGSFSVADGATLGINVSSPATATVPMSDLTLGNSASTTVAFNFSGNPSASVAPVTAYNLTANGGANAVTLKVTFNAGVTVGQYPLIQYPNGSIGGTGVSAFKLAPLPSYLNAVLVNNTANNSIDINVTAAPWVEVAVTSSVNPCVLGQPVTLTATVSGSNGPPTGTVTFMNGTATLGSATLDGSGVAALPVTFSTVGSPSITAVYNGNSTYGSTASLVPLMEVVNPGLATWTGMKNNVWDIKTTTNWFNFGSPATYYDGNQVQFDDTATGSTAISLGVNVSPNSVTFTNNTQNYSLSGKGAIAGTASLTKSGTGTVTLSNTNTYTGMTLVSNGALTFTNGGSSTGNNFPGVLYVGGGSGVAILNMNSTGSLLFSGFSSLGGISGDQSDTGSGAIYQTAGTISFNYISTANGYNIEIGTGAPGAYGYYNLSGGALNTLYAAPLCIGALGQGVFVQTGGTLNAGAYLDIGTYSRSTGNGGNGVATFTGGSATIGTMAIQPIRLGVEPGGSGVMNLGTEAGGTATVSGSTIELLAGGTASSGVLNLNSGTLQLTGYIYLNPSTGTDLLSLNGATLRAGANNARLLDSSLDNVMVFNGGVVIDTQNYTANDSAILQAPGGNGIYPTGGILTITNSGGSNYIGAPLVTVSGGSGSDAMAIANVSGGVLTGVTLTCPGMNYLAGDTLSFAFAGGGTTTPASTFNYTLQAGDVAPNSLGGLTKIGSGTLILSGDNGYNGYTGYTVVSNGTLEVDGSIGGGVTVAGGTLDGIGSINGAVTVQNGGTLSCGALASIGQLSQLSISSTLSLSGNVSLRLDKTGGGSACDNVTGLTGVTYGGTLTVTDITSDGTPLALGDTFTLFSSSAYSGSFGAFNLPALPSGLAWDTSKLTVNGSFQVASVSTTPTTIVYTPSGMTMNLSWPSDHTGWRLLVQTNNLALGLSVNINDWGTVAGSSVTNQVSIPINATLPTEFYRLVYP